MEAPIAPAATEGRARARAEAAPALARDAAGEDALAALKELVGREIGSPASPAARALAAEIRRRHGPSVAAVLFYGSCLRRGTSEGVHDFYVIVDSYQQAYRGSPRPGGAPRGRLRAAALAAANRALAPNVFYFEHDHAGRRLRTKYGVLSTRDFLRATGTRHPHTLVWARFCQPFRLLEARDERARELVVRGAVRAITTALDRLVPLLPAVRNGQRFASGLFWERCFTETWSAELRTEGKETVSRIYESDRERYDRVAALGLRALAARGRLELEERDGGLRVRISPARAAWRRLSWRRRRLVAKSLATANLLKTTATFGDWVPYALWKLERHTGVRLHLTERQRRHPLVFGWPSYSGS